MATSKVKELPSENDNTKFVFIVIITIIVIIFVLGAIMVLLKPPFFQMFT